jgi:hypothetical protein
MNKPIRKPVAVPSPKQGPKPQTPTPPLKETDEGKQARVDKANAAIQALCAQYHVAFHVPNLDISSGKIWPVIKLMALDLP